MEKNELRPRAEVLKGIQCPIVAREIAKIYDKISDVQRMTQELRDELGDKLQTVDLSDELNDVYEQSQALVEGWKEDACNIKKEAK